MIVKQLTDRYIQISGPKEKNLILLTKTQAEEVVAKLRLLLLRDLNKQHPGLAEQIKDED
jgi:hypothetical protein